MLPALMIDLIRMGFSKFLTETLQTFREPSLPVWRNKGACVVDRGLKILQRFLSVIALKAARGVGGH